MNGSSVTQTLELGLRALHRIEDGVLLLLLGSMVLLAPAQILLRNFFDASIAWGDPLLRLLVLWLGLFGALAASREGRHIGIDVLSRILSERGRCAARAATGLFTAGVAGVVAYHGSRFVVDEMEFGGTAFAGLPVWLCEVVIPFAFGMIALRHALRVLLDGRTLLRGEAGPR